MSKKNLPRVAYFCMEYGLDSKFKIYSGGLGVLAGDIIKAAKDIEVPMVAIGIRWKMGYVEQYIDECGKPYDSYRDYDYDFLEDTGVKVSVKIKDEEVHCKVLKTEAFGNIPLYLLDADVPENGNRLITSKLYGGFSEDRIAQELILGVAGLKALRALGLEIDVYHFNDSHPIFAGVQLICDEMEKGLSFEEALENVKRNVVFTTHTPVPAGNEVHSHRLLQYMGAYLDLNYDDMVKLGGDPFNMTVAGLRLSKIANGVASLHKETSNKMWNDVTGRPEIIGVTNGIHTPTWQDERIVKAFNENGDLLKTHQEIKEELIDYIYKKSSVKLDADKLLIGFARRAAPYKRSDLLFYDEEKIESYLKEGKIQIIFSGKSHPNDLGGKDIISNIVRRAKKYPNSVVFVENYDMEVGAMVTRGCDIWLNNPRRPMEASGTSGMKAAMNGVLNVSVLDGWWPEACNHGINGWQFGDAKVFDNVEEFDKHDAEKLYEILFEEVLPTFYNNKERWAEMMRNSIESTQEMFSAERMVRDYYEKMYTL